MLENARLLNTLKASAEIGFPHPTAPLVQWSNALIAFRREPEFLYLKAYKPLVPFYFLLKSYDRRFWLFFPREYKVYWGENSLLEKDPDIDLRVIAGDLIRALTPEEIDANARIIWKPTQTGSRLTITGKEDRALRELDFDQARNPRIITEFNEAGFMSLRIEKNEWRAVGGVKMPYEIKIKRLVPHPNDMIIRFKEIRTNQLLESAILDHQFPLDVSYAELKETE